MFALEEEEDREEEMFAVVDRQQWNTQRAAEPPLSPELQQMFALARRMGYEMRPIARRFDAPQQAPGPRLSQNKDYRAPFRPRDYSRTKCFSCGQLGHTQVRCPKPDSSLPVLVSNFSQETVVVSPFTEVGMIAQVTAIQSVTDDRVQRRGVAGELPHGW